MKKLAIQKVKVSGQIPSPRFGHTFTMISPSKAVLFGGAVSLAGKFVITNETYLYDFCTMKWKKISFQQNFMPSERAAHAATMISEMQMVIFGGAASGTQGLLKDQLYLLDLRRQPAWKIIQVSNKSQTPGQRYGHSMVYSKPYLVVFGGNSGNRAENDVWILNILKGPFTWSKYQFSNSIAPCPRVYHSAAICEEGSAYGMMVVFGGRKQTKKDPNSSQKQLTCAALNDVWGLRKHRDGSWDWVTPPKSPVYTPVCRYQHLVCFMGSMLVIMGGRSNNPDQTVSLIEMYDTETSEWHKLNSISRYRHAIALYDKNKLYVHGGFQPEFASQPLQTMVSIDLSGFSAKSANQQIENRTEKTNLRKVEEQGRQPRENKEVRDIKEMRDNKELRQIRDSERNMNQNSRIRSGTSYLDRSKVQRQRDLTPSRVINSSKNIRLSNQVMVARGDTNLQIQKVPMNSLMEESKRLTCLPEESISNLCGVELIQNIISILMPLNGSSKVNLNSIFPLKKDKIVQLCQQASKVLIKEGSLVGVRAPAKIFGGLYGRYNDLIRLFQNFGYPDDREMETYQYVFLGNYVDKGTNSLQTLCLLLALKIKYPDHFHLLRGRHEDINLNRICGLGQECSMRLGENISEPQSIFNIINNLFNQLPLAAAIDDKFLCLNSEIGNVGSIIQIKDVQRPVKMIESQTIIDLTWSGLQNNAFTSYKSKKSSEEEIDKFLDENGLEMIINTKDGLINGIEQNGNILSIFSATNYPPTNNKSAILKINKNHTVIPCIIDGLTFKKTGWISEITKVTYTEQEKQLRKLMFEKI